MLRERERERERASEQGKDVERSPAGAVHTDLEEMWVKSGFFCFSNIPDLFTKREQGKRTLLSPMSEWKPSLSPWPRFELQRGGIRHVC